MSFSPHSYTSNQAANIYRRAAKMLEDGTAHHQWSCWAICTAAEVPLYNDSDPRPVLVERYESLFKPRGERHTWGYRWAENYYERLDCRIVALCFMAAIAETEKLSFATEEKR